MTALPASCKKTNPNHYQNILKSEFLLLFYYGGPEASKAFIPGVLSRASLYWTCQQYTSHLSSSELGFAAFFPLENFSQLDLQYKNMQFFINSH